MEIFSLSCKQEVNRKKSMFYVSWVRFLGGDLVSRRQTVNACLFGLDRRRHLYIVAPVQLGLTNVNVRLISVGPRHMPQDAV